MAGRQRTAAIPMDQRAVKGLRAGEFRKELGFNICANIGRIKFLFLRGVQMEWKFLIL